MAAIRNTTNSTIRGFRARSNPNFQSSLKEQDFVGEVEMVHTDFSCPSGHVVTIPFAAQAEIPDGWVCLKHQKPAHRVGVEAAESDDSDDSATQTPMYPGGWYTKHHWKCLKERRTPEEAETILNNALARARARIGDIAA
jgi:hypothetical protein